MVYKPHYLVTFGGKLKADSPNDIWQCNVRCVANPAAQYTGGGVWSNTDHTSEAEEDLIDRVKTKLQAWWTTGVGTAGTSFVGTYQSASLEWIKLNKIAPGPNAATPGVYASTTTTHIRYFSGLNTGTGNASVPPEMSLKYSWTTDVTRGPGAFGGVYPPIGIMQTAPTSNYVLATSMANHLTYAKNLLNCFSINNVSLTTGVPSLTPVIASAGSVKKNIPGANYKITGVRVGNVLDIQRRRKSTAVESYTSGTVVLAD